MKPMPDYKEMLRKQGKSPLGYPSTMPQGKPPRDYSNSPLRKLKMTEDYQEEANEPASDRPDEKEQLQILSQYANDNIAGLESVFGSLPQSGTVQNARFFFGTACLWLQMAFRETEDGLKRQERAHEFKSRRTEVTEALNDQMFKGGEG